MKVERACRQAARYAALDRQQVRAQLEAMRADDLEIHYLAGHGWRHSSEPVTAALDTAHTLCRSDLLFHTHADCFLRRRDFLEDLAGRCNAAVPVIGHRMSPHDWATHEGQWIAHNSAIIEQIQKKLGG